MLLLTQQFLCQQGIKLELFIFDTFPMAAKVALLEAPRAQQFAPVKNAVGADSPATAREAVLRLHSGWVLAAGGSVAPADDATATAAAAEDVAAAVSTAAAGSAAATPLGVEVSPLLSYAGEGLEAVCKGQTFANGTAIS